MKYTFILSGETPAKKNSRLTLPHGKTIPSERFRKWHEVAKMELLIQKNKLKTFFPATKDNPCCIMLTFIHGDLRRRDSDNGTSSILDLLTDCKILER